VTESNAVFLSYATEDAVPAERLCATLRAAGIEVWFDQSELRGGDAWDAAIRKQIRSCALFIPLISANSQARAEGYFRLEWKLAVDRSHLMAADKAFLLPIVIDDTRNADARVPDRFRELQWTSLPGGETPTIFIERLQRLLAPPEHQSPTAMRTVSGASHTTTAYGKIPEKSIAVLPFADMSAQKDHEYFSDGLAEALIDMLTQVRDLRVPARTSSFSFKGKSDDIESIAEKLRVAHILEGSVRKAGNRIRVTVHLIRADNGYHLWSNTYDRNLEDVFSVQDEIAGIVVEALKARLLPAQGVVNPHRTSSVDAYEQYLFAKQFYNRGAVDGAHRATAALQQALALDPDYGSAHAQLAINLCQRLSEGDAPTHADQAIAAAEKAVVLAPMLSEAYSARSLVRSLLQWNWRGARADIEKALQLDPRSEGSQRRYGLLLATLGRSPEAISALQLATEIEPLDIHAWFELGWCFTYAGQFVAGRRALDHALELSPASPTAMFLLAQDQIANGETSEAIKTNSRQPIEPWRWGIGAIIEYRLGNAAESQRALDELINKYGPRAPSHVAQVYAWRGETEKLFEWLDRAYVQHDLSLGMLQITFPLWAARDDPRYTALLRKMNFPE
jgi:TolB-like protein/tetratricopeptide (TPR) repeat protein